MTTQEFDSAKIEPMQSLSIPGIHSYIEVAKTAVGNIVCSYSYQVHRLTEKWRLSSGPSVTKPFIAQHLPVIQSLLVQHFKDITLNTGASDLGLGVALPKEQMERHKSSCISVASNFNSRLHLKKTNIAQSTIFLDFFTRALLDQSSYGNHMVWKATYPLVNLGLLSLTSVIVTNSCEVTENVPSVALIRRMISLLFSRSRFPITVIFPDKPCRENFCAYSLDNKE